MYFLNLKTKKSKNYSLIFKLTDDSSTSFLEVDDDYSSVRHLFDKYQCTTCHTKDHEVDLTGFVSSDSQDFYKKVLKAIESRKMPPKGLKRPQKKILAYLGVGFCMESLMI